MTLDNALELILGNLGVLVLLLFVLFGGFKGWWVFGWYAREQKERIKDLERKLDKSSMLAENATDQVSKVVTLAEKRAEAS